MQLVETRTLFFCCFKFLGKMALQEDGEVDDEICEEMPVIGFWSAFIWLIIMTLTIAILSEYVVGTIEVYIYM